MCAFMEVPDLVRTFLGWRLLFVRTVINEMMTRSIGRKPDASTDHIKLMMNSFEYMEH